MKRAIAIVVCLCLVCWLPAPKVRAQQAGFDIEAHINGILQQGDETQNRNYYDLLVYFYDNPLDLNRASAQELAELGLLSRKQIAAILEHRQQTGPFLSVYELQALPGFTPGLIRQIWPFLTAGQRENLGGSLRKLFRARHNYMASGYSRIWPAARGYGNGAYRGSPDRLQLRLRLRLPGRLSAGLTAQKDPGEPLFPTRPPVPDFLSAHLYLENQGRLQQLAVGDYRLQFGQGLLLGAGFMVGKNAETVTTAKQATLGVIPYSSITESRYFRGSALTLQVAPPLRASLFYSYQYLDATVSGSLNRQVSAIRTTGLHRTAAEEAGRDQLREQVWGGALTYEQGNLATGVLLVNTHFDKTLEPPPHPYNRYRFRGRQLLNYGWFGQWSAGSFLFFGEAARTHRGGMGLNFGLLGSLNTWADISLLYRNFAPGFHSFYGLPFSERSVLGNENGLYWGLKLYPLPRTTLSAYFDMYRFPWLTSLTAAPVNGYDYLVRLDHEINDHNRFYLQWRQEKSFRREDNGNLAIDRPATLVRALLNFDLNTEYPLWFRTRLQYNRYARQQSETGWLIFQEVNYQQGRVMLSGRVLLFDTDSYNSRQYVYERDMLFSYVTRVFSGRGMAYYLLVRYKIARPLSLRLKWSLTAYTDRAAIGSGNDLLDASSRSQVSGQLYFTF